MKLDDLAKLVGDKSGVAVGPVKRALKALVEVLRGEVQAHGKVYLNDLGTFSLKERAARTVKPGFGNGETIHVPAQKTVTFKPTSSWKEAVNLK